MYQLIGTYSVFQRVDRTILIFGFGKLPSTVQVRFRMMLLSWWSPSPTGNLDTVNLLSAGTAETYEGAAVIV